MYACPEFYLNSERNLDFSFSLRFTTYTPEALQLMPVRQPRPAERTLYVVNKTLEDPPLLDPEA